MEDVWQYLRQNWLSNTVFESYDAMDKSANQAQLPLSMFLRLLVMEATTRGERVGAAKAA